MFSLKTTLGLLILIIASTSTALAQANAKVSGTVTDPNGAAVPGAVVKLTNQATKIEVDTTTNESGGPASWILGNWQTNFIMQARSGAPFNVQVTGDFANLRSSAPTAPGNYLRPNLIADPFVAGPVAANPDPACQRTISQGGKAADQVRTIASWFNPCAFGIPSGSFGSLGRNAFRGKAVFNTDLSLFKSFPIRENWEVQLRVESFNIFNIQNWDTPANANLTLNTNATTLATNVGRISNLASGTNPRQIQFGVRLMF